jgi:DNA-binding NarL/FixJ family response regulator
MNSRNIISNRANANSTPDACFHHVIELIKREVEVLQLVSMGKSNIQIAEMLLISLPTVRCHMENIMGKLQVHNRTEAVYMATQQGWLDLPKTSTLKENH